jgi:hypothetical protein
VQRAESKAVDVVFAILGLPRAEGPLTAQITLSLHNRGLGLSHTCPAKGSAVYLANAATIHQAMRNEPEAFGPLDGPRGEQLRPHWAFLHCGAGALWLSEFQEVSPSSLDTMQRHSVSSPGTRHRLAPTPCLSPLMPALKKGKVPAPAFSAAPAVGPRTGLTRSSPGPLRSRVGKFHWPPPPPRH